MNGGLRHGVTSLNVMTSREDAPIDLLSGMPLPVALRTESLNDRAICIP